MKKLLLNAFPIILIILFFSIESLAQFEWPNGAKCDGNIAGRDFVKPEYDWKMYVDFVDQHMKK